jgi:hypothetical protein
MFEVRWFVPKSDNGTKPVLQYREVITSGKYDETMKITLMNNEWSEWKNVPTVYEQS